VNSDELKRRAPVTYRYLTFVPTRSQSGGIDTSGMRAELIDLLGLDAEWYDGTGPTEVDECPWWSCALGREVGE